MKAVTIKVVGKVQGVWFRASTKAKAEELNLNGEVKNMQDGSVFVRAEGNEDDIQTFINWCKIGPEMATVNKIIITNTMAKQFTDFNIVRN